ncbi:small GTP-binding protein [Histomonas meleagridis]|uniref:small GTP-binding protein n=1 Tax=Histomonas meleagridis TaxID=135588 RepID=UPI00355A736A|nr:small GTP-binding protein [Histomonas meleagridis]KAH0803868.1 small GTP-binding protein [Histomonas meleagridis]
MKAKKGSSSPTYKVVMVGNSGVGKTTIINRIYSGNFLENHVPTTGSQYVTITSKVDERIVNLELWDTAGQEAYRGLVGFYARDSKGAFLVCDVSKQDSFQSLSQWVDFVKESAPDAKIYLFANKVDLDDRVITSQQIEQFAEDQSIEWSEGSAKTGQGINDLVSNIASILYETFGENGTTHSSVTLEDGKKQKCSC